MEQSLEPVSTEYWSVRKLEGTSIRIRKVDNSMVSRQTDRQRDRRTDGQTDQTDRQTDGQTDRQTDGRTDQTDGQTNRRTDGRTESQERQINRKIKTSRELDGHEDRQLGGWTGQRTEADRQSHSPHDDSPFFGKRKTDVIVPVCPPMLLISLPVSASHNLSMVSRL